MKVVSKDDVGAPVLDDSPDSFADLLETLLVPEGWTVITHAASVLEIENENGRVLYCDDLNTGFAYIRGYANQAALGNLIKAVPSLSQSLSGSTVMKVTGGDWKLFYDSNSFYFFHNDEVYGFGEIQPIIGGTNEDDFIVIGRQDAITAQVDLANSVGTAFPGMYLLRNLGALSLSIPGGGNFDDRIDEIDAAGFAIPFLTISGVLLHNASKQVIGACKRLWTLSSKMSVVDGNTIRSQHGILLYCVKAGSRYYAVEIE